MRSLKTLALGCAAAPGLLAMAPAAQAATFSVQTQACVVDNQFNSPTPVTSSGLCDPFFGSSAATAFATFGSVGAAAEANATGQSLSLIGGEGFASFRDVIRLKKIDPTVPDIVAVSLNLGFSGGFLATSAPNHGAAAGYGFTVLTPGGTFNGSGSFNTSLGFSGVSSGLGESVAGPGLYSFNLVTPTFLVDFGTQSTAAFEIGFSLRAAASAFGLANGVSDFSHTLAFPTGTAVFNLPTGYTAEAGSYLVDNRFIDPNTAPVPEPATWATMIIGFGLTGLAWRRQVRSGAQAPAS